MRPFHETIPLARALELLLDAATPIARTERVRLDEAHGRVVAAPAVSTLDVPPFDRAAMDGYAVIAEDTFTASAGDPTVLRCIERLYTGHVPVERVSSGTCIEIATGAPLPDGANAVVMVEDTEQDGDAIRVLIPVHPRQHVGRRAADIAIGQIVVKPGDVLSPSRIGALAATGVTDVEVYARPRVAVLSTGNEIVEPGQPLRPGQIYDINRFTLSSVVDLHGGQAVAYAPTGDTLAELLAAVTAAADDDLLVFSGGSSVGERDLMRDLVAASGEIIFHGIAVKPGKPTMLGRIGEKLVLGMPGYPTSCLSNAYILLVPLLRRLARLPPYRPQQRQLPLARRVASTTGRHQFFTVRIEDGTAVPAFKASGDITSMSQADGYIEIPAHTDFVDAGTVVDVKLF